MGMPSIISTNIERSQAITDLIESIALEEAAIAHILNAEGEKLQLIIARATADSTIPLQDLLDANNSVTELVTSVSSLESHLQAKLALFADSANVSFYFMKRSSVGNTPLGGAVFNLSQGESIIATATSDSNGVVFFPAVSPGNYTLAEVSAPEDYTPDPTIYDVVVTNTASINGTLSSAFTIYNGAPWKSSPE